MLAEKVLTLTRGLLGSARLRPTSVMELPILPARAARIGYGRWTAPETRSCGERRRRNSRMIRENHRLALACVPTSIRIPPLFGRGCGKGVPPAASHVCRALPLHERSCWIGSASSPRNLMRARRRTRGGCGQGPVDDTLCPWRRLFPKKRPVGSSANSFRPAAQASGAWAQGHTPDR